MNVNLDRIDYKIGTRGEMCDHLLSFYDYLKDAESIANAFALPSYFINCQKVVIVGMGASGIGGKIIKDLLVDSNRQIEVVSDYHLPSWVDKNTLLIAVSHSGNTEEVLSLFVDGYQREAKLLAVSSGGKLESLCSKYRSPIIKYDFDSEPKLAFPYLFLIPLIILDKIGCYEYDQNSLSETKILLEKQLEKIGPGVHALNNPAKDLALKIEGKIPLIISAENLKSIGERFAQSINEDGKHLSAFNFLPEVDHNLIAGLENPKGKLDDLLIINIESKFSSPDIKKRFNITSSLFSKRKIDYLRLSFEQASNKLSEILLAINFCSFSSFYLGIANQADPLSAQAVEYVKSELTRE